MTFSYVNIVMIRMERIQSEKETWTLSQVFLRMEIEYFSFT